MQVWALRTLPTTFFLVSLEGCSGSNPKCNRSYFRPSEISYFTPNFRGLQPRKLLWVRAKRKLGLQRRPPAPLLSPSRDTWLPKVNHSSQTVTAPSSLLRLGREYILTFIFISPPRLMECLHSKEQRRAADLLCQGWVILPR